MARGIRWQEVSRAGCIQAIWHCPPPWSCHLSCARPYLPVALYIDLSLVAFLPLLFHLGLLFSNRGFPVVSFGPWVVVRTEPRGCVVGVVMSWGCTGKWAREDSAALAWSQSPGFCMQTPGKLPASTARRRPPLCGGHCFSLPRVPGKQDVEEDLGGCQGT